MRNAWRTLINGKDGKPVLGQRPNLALSLWIICVVANRFITNPTADHNVGLAGHVAITVWAVMEVSRGASYLRRTLGLVVLILTFISWFW